MNQNNNQLQHEEKNVTSKYKTMSIYDKPRIYIACLASYNAGVLYGEWIIPATNKDELQKQIDDMLKKSQQPYAEEWAVHDYDSFYNLGEYPDLENIIKVQENYQNFHTDEIVNAFLENWSVDDLDRLDDAFMSWGWDSFQEFAEHEADEMLNEHLNDSSSWIRSYFDYKSYATDLEHDYYYCDTKKNGTAIFHTNW